MSKHIQIVGKVKADAGTTISGWVRTDKLSYDPVAIDRLDDISTSGTAPPTALHRFVYH